MPCLNSGEKMKVKHDSKIQEKQPSSAEPIKQKEEHKEVQDMGALLCRKPEQVDKAAGEGFTKLKQRYIEQRSKNKIAQPSTHDNHNNDVCNEDTDDDRLQFDMEL